MHRSGTSAITHALEVLGVRLGERLLGPVPGVNDKGFFEESEIYEFDDEILRRYGRSWYSLGGSDIAEDPDQLDRELRERAVELLDARLSKHQTFGMKDPRFCVTWPYWKFAADQIGVKVDAVYALRRPLHVANSLLRRDGLLLEHGLLLWARYNLSALRHVATYPHVMVNYDHLVDAPMELLAYLSECLDLPFDSDSPEAREYTSQFVDPSLRHFSQAQGGFDGRSQAMVAQSDAAWEALVALSEGQSLPVGDLSEDVAWATARLGELVRPLALMGDFLGESAMELIARRGADESMQQALARLEGENAELRDELLRRNDELAVHRERLLECESLLHSEHEAKEERQRKVFSLEREIQALHASTSWRLTAPLRAAARAFTRPSRQ
jgi:hypothetical protein